MEDPDTITTDTARLLPRQTRRPRTSSVRMSDTEPTTLINRNRTTSTASYQNAEAMAPPLPEEEEYQGNCLTDPRSFCHRLIALILMCLLGFGSYFCFDNPGALQKEIKDAMGISTYQFSQLYAWYSWPNVILPIVGGYLMDSVFGIRLGTVIFASFIILGQIVFSLGGLTNSFGLMQIGRFVFGIGGESLAVAQNTYAVSWFKGKELNMVFGFQLSVARVGSTVNFSLMAPLYKYISQWYNPHTAVGWTLMVAGLTCVMSFVCAVILGLMDKRAERILKKASVTDTGETFTFRDVLSFPTSFWLLSIVCLAYYVAIFPFISLGQVFFMKKFDFSSSNANFITGLIYLLSAPASPILGILIDKTGRNVMYCTVSIVVTLICHVMLAFTFINPYVAIVLMGLSYSLLASALWPIAALVIPEYQLGTAYGLMQAIQNAGLALITMVAGLIVDNHGYIWLELFFIFWLVVALVATIAIWIIDISGDGYLNMGIQQREDFDKAKKEAEEEEARRKAELANPIRPKTARAIRNKYLLRVGAVIPSHMGHSRLLVPQDMANSPRP
eukprot:14307.XXX_1090838_1092743_1 [CDS] Oithona nana genome sequencing.